MVVRRSNDMCNDCESSLTLKRDTCVSFDRMMEENDPFRSV